MRKNIGTTDRIIRFFLAAVLIGFLVTHSIPAGRGEFLGWAFVAVLLITALDETCPVYLLLGTNTRRKTGKVSPEKDSRQ